MNASGRYHLSCFQNCGGRHRNNFKMLHILGFVSPSSHLFLNSLWIEVAGYENDARELRPGGEEEEVERSEIAHIDGERGKALEGVAEPEHEEARVEGGGGGGTEDLSPILSNFLNRSTFFILHSHTTLHHPQWPLPTPPLSSPLNPCFPPTTTLSHPLQPFPNPSLASTCPSIPGFPLPSPSSIAQDQSSLSEPL